MKQKSNVYTTYQFPTSNEFKEYIEKYKDVFDISDEERTLFKEWCKDRSVDEILHIEVEEDNIKIKHEKL